MNIAHAVHLLWPLLLIVAANTLYHLSTRNAPASAHPFAILPLAYLLGAALSLALFFLLPHEGTLLKNLRQAAPTAAALGIAIVALEAGFLFLYRAGWRLSIGALCANLLLAVILLAVGVFVYREPLTARHLLGVAVCLLGLVLVVR